MMGQKLSGMGRAFLKTAREEGCKGFKLVVTVFSSKKGGARI
jgi:hypothetical protein